MELDCPWVWICTTDNCADSAEKSPAIEQKLKIELKMRVIFVEPKIEGNLGFLARSMANFDLNELFLVKPQFKISFKDKMYAAHAKEILESAKIVNSLNEAVKDLDFIIGTTGIKTTRKNILRRSVEPEKLRELLKNCKGKVGILFGREDSGLSNSELKICDFVVRIKTSEKYPVMNITHAAAIIFYELYKDEIPAQTENVKKEKEELEKTFKAVITKLDYSENKRDFTTRCFKNLIGRSFVFKEEAKTLIGVFKKIDKKLRRNYVMG